MKSPLSALLATTAAVIMSMTAYAAAHESGDATEEPVPQVSAPKEVQADSKPKDYTILRLGADEVKYSEAEDLWKGLFPDGTAPDFSTFDETIKQNVLRGMVSEKLIFQEAVKEGYDKSEEVQKRLESLKKQLIMQSFMESKAKTLVTDSQLKAAYAAKTSSMKNEEEVRARHILVASEDEAKAIAKQVKEGADFEKLAAEKSQDKGSGTQGGDLGYFTKDKMVPEFAEAAFKMKKGDISNPVKSSFGWHVIKLEDRRKVKIPSFEEMREELQADVANEAVQKYVETLLKKADIKYYGPDGRERDFSRKIEAKQ